MTDAHTHVSGGESGVREYLAGRDFLGVHPWQAEEGVDSEALRRRLLERPDAGVGEIGLDRLRARTVSPRMREVFARQLDIAAELGRPVTLHGAKCWGQVVQAVRGRRLPSLLFHGFSRSDGLLPEIVAMGGYVSVGPAVLNDHAVNYRELVKKIPRERLLVETDRDSADPEALRPTIGEVLVGLAKVLGVPADELEAATDANAERFFTARR